MSHFVSGPEIQVVELAQANVEYAVKMPPCTRLEIQPRQNVDLRLAYRQGDTADGRPYRTIKATLPPYREDAIVSILMRTLYFRSPVAGTVVEIVFWA